MFGAGFFGGIPGETGPYTPRLPNEMPSLEPPADPIPSRTAPESIPEPTPTVKYPDSNYKVQTNQTPEGTQYDVYYDSPTSRGTLQSTFDSATGRLTMELIDVKPTQQGLGSAMVAKLLTTIRGTGATVNSIAGKMSADNKATLLADGLEATPAYKLRVQNGFPFVQQRPDAANNYWLIMGTTPE